MAQWYSLFYDKGIGYALNLQLDTLVVQIAVQAESGVGVGLLGNVDLNKLPIHTRVLAKAKPVFLDKVPDGADLLPAPLTRQFGYHDKITSFRGAVGHVGVHQLLFALGLAHLALVMR